MARPVLTVFTPNYNHARFVGQAIESVISQSTPPDQYVIVDDGSSDDSAAIIGRYAQQIPYIDFIAGPHRGLWPTVESGLARAAGDYVMVLSADDYVLPGFFEKALAAARRHPAAGVIFGLLEFVDSAGQVASTQSLPPGLSDGAEVFLPPERFLREYLSAIKPYHSQTAAALYRREALLAVGYARPELGAWSDTFAAWAISLQHGACLLNCAGTAFRQGSNHSVSASWHGDARMAISSLTCAARLMRSPRFCACFPADFVTRWHAAYVEDILRAQRRRIIAHLEADLQTLPLPPELDRRPLLGLQRALALRVVKMYVSARVRFARRLAGRGLEDPTTAE